MRREIISASSDYENKFRETWRLRDDLENDPYWQMAYEHSAKNMLYADEINAIGSALVRKDVMYKASELREISIKSIERQNLIPAELKRVNELMLKFAQDGFQRVTFSFGGDYPENDAVVKAVIKELSDKGFETKFESKEIETIGFHNSNWDSVIHIKW